MDVPCAPQAPIVIKLLQESLFWTLPCSVDFLDNCQYAEWLPGAQLAANEAYAYDCMRTLQGNGSLLN